jgi:hypothetical protein
MPSLVWRHFPPVPRPVPALKKAPLVSAHLGQGPRCTLTSVIFKARLGRLFTGRFLEEATFSRNNYLARLLPVCVPKFIKLVLRKRGSVGLAPRRGGSEERFCRGFPRGFVAGAAPRITVVIG